MRQVAALLLLVAPSVARAQQPTGLRPAGSPAPVPCAGQRISEILIFASAPSVASLERVPVLATIARSAHRTTRPEVIRRFLLLDEGERCDERRRAESERLLRAQPFLADAAVVAVPSDSGTVALEVATIDEVSAVLGGRVNLQSPMVRGVRFGNANLGGEGIYAAGDWGHREGYRDQFGMRVTAYQLFGQRWIGSAQLRRDALGGFWGLEAAYPFQTDLQRIAWRVRNLSARDFVRLRSATNDDLAADVQRQRFQLGGVARIGPPTRLGLLGMAVTHERDSAAPTLVRRTPTGIGRAGVEPLQELDAGHMTRLNVLLGLRQLRFVPVRGFDALTGAQDLPVGAQLGLIAGRSIGPQTGQSDVLIGGDLYYGRGNARRAWRLSLEGEARREFAAPQWEDVLLTGRLARYDRRSATHTFVLSADGAAVARARMPVQLALGDPDGGMRGFRDSRSAGAARLIVRADDRHFLGRVGTFAELGWAAFAETGKLWAGSVPFGVETAPQLTLGGSLLVAVPPGSGRLWRLDFALPIGNDPYKRFEVRVRGRDHTGFFWRVPDELERLRRGWRIFEWL